tara:strand:+ start:94 stop:444 length:351 start_codon:yes stop_codon:yes gene_type:complete
MAAAKHNLVIEQGVDFTLEVTLTDSSGSAINLTNATFTSNIRRSPETDAIKLGNTPITFAKSGNNLANGEVVFTLTEAQTAALPGDNLIYDIFRTIGNETTRDLEGEIEVIERVTY